MTDGNKAKIAKRVIEVFEFFNEKQTEATVMSIARRYDWPQSSTSELLSNLVELGLLYKNCQTRTYRLTPRAALLGCGSQPRVVRDGRIFAALDLVADTGHGAAVLGQVNLDAQVFASRSAAKSSENPFGSGRKERLSQTAAGWLLLSTIAPKRREAVIRRINADAEEPNKFCVSQLCDQVSECEERGFAVGPAGFGSADKMCAILLPDQQLEQPIAIGLSCTPAQRMDATATLALLRDKVRAALAEHREQVRNGAEDVRPRPLHAKRATEDGPAMSYAS